MRRIKPFSHEERPCEWNLPTFGSLKAIDRQTALNKLESEPPDTFPAVSVCRERTCPLGYSQWKETICIDRLVPLEHSEGAAVELD